MPAVPRSEKLGKLLLALPRLPVSASDPAHALVAELSQDWELHLAAAQLGEAESDYLLGLGTGVALPGHRSPEAFLDYLKSCISEHHYAAVLLEDHPATLPHAALLRQFCRVPLVCVQWDRLASRGNGAGVLARLRARESAERARGAAHDIWSLGPGRSQVDGSRLKKRLLRLAASAARPRRDRGLASIIIPCFNKLRYTRECLEAVARHTPFPHELIIVDNGSTDGTAAFVRKRGKARLIVNRVNRGFAPAINQGIAASKGRYVVLLNNDAVVTPGWLERLVACAERSSRFGAVGPCTNEAVGVQRVAAPPYVNHKQLCLFAEAWALKHGGQSLLAHRLTGFCLLLKREAIRRVGLLDERFATAYYEDFDYCLRLRQAGYDLACALDVYVHHHGHKSSASPEAMIRRVRDNREVFLDKWCHRALSFLDELDPEAATMAGRLNGGGASAPKRSV